MYNLTNFTERINQIKEKYSFKSILVCLYFKNVYDKKLVDHYLNNGYILCSAGHKWDKHFLDRLKTIISLADNTISNDVGTNVGYCISLKKPHTILKSEIKYRQLNRAGYDQIRVEISRNRQLETNDVKDGFLRTDDAIFEKINNNQIQLINKYWGLDSIKTKNELFSILK